MIRRGQISVRGKRKDGADGPIDVLDLEEDSFRAWVAGALKDGGLVAGLSDSNVRGDRVPMKERIYITCSKCGQDLRVNNIFVLSGKTVYVIDPCAECEKRLKKKRRAKK